ncbi:hypothetical protein EV659_11425 [Rhodothalassium salexigens DSM 2132]|uniref:Uncharacterized protein n=1 Tax=Rhodothalassium salexigens DSM 2132 TaxID=1188247 RepID=A0A4V2SNB4_RHOSA|nr:phage tail tube protein [Rhodothalassium salexigens]MBB4212683.1 hypothetical protein [Rhodothalassium salexigens DSM 2132]MBK1637991.1 hypothetical protein [Rhodothalassium salexigens DSM 2132]TCP30436.1 hypothetical protein EV659_11425 [Rhodothalassium salexigens DSM 2132]
MPKVRAYGADATLKACREMSYGTAPLTGYQSLDFKSTDLSSVIPLDGDPLLGRGRNAQDPYRGLVTDEGQIEIPFDLQGTGFWLTALFGNPVTTDNGDDTYTHVWDSGADHIPSYTIEIGHPKLTTPTFFRHTGARVESLSFDMGQEGPANARLQLVAQGEERFAATVDTDPSAYTLRRFSQGRGFLRRGGAALAGVTEGRLTVSNNLERVRVIRDDGRIEAADPTLASAEGAISVRFDGATLVDEAANGDPVALAYGFSTAQGHELRFDLPRVFLPKPKYALSGPGGVQADFDWRAAFDATERFMLRAHLTNDVSSYA